jgi:hypothetical protein
VHDSIVSSAANSGRERGGKELRRKGTGASQKNRYKIPDRSAELRIDDKPFEITAEPPQRDPRSIYLERTSLKMLW